jgi:uncharacterized protein (TIGR02271 family)
LVDEDGRFRYLVINTGAWIFGKKVLLPIGRARIDYNARRVYADGLTKDQVERLPEFTDDLKLDYEHEEDVRNVYRSGNYPEMPVESSSDIRSTTPVEGTTYTGSSMGAPTTGAYVGDLGTTSSMGMAGMTRPTYDRDTYDYDYDRDLYDTSRQDERIRLYEERLIANKQRQKAGEVAIGKHVETERAQVEVPVEKERVVVERVAPTDINAVPGEGAFQEGEVARMEVYEETPDIQKETFVREEVRVKKVVDQDVVTAEDEIRREELNIDSQGRPIVDDSGRRIDDSAKRV